MAAGSLHTSSELSLPSSQFRTTDWEMVLSAGNVQSPTAEEALERLCQIYWYPVYAFVRRCGKDPHEAKDLAQDFFTHLLENEILKGVAPDKGRFRSFLLVSLKNLLANDWKHTHAVKRGGRNRFVALDDVSAESRYQRELSHDSTPEKLFDLAWVSALLERVHKALKEAYSNEGKETLFDNIEGCVCGEASESYAAIGARLDMSEGAIKMAVLRLRKRYRKFLATEVANTVQRPEHVEAELRELLGCV